MVRVAVLDDYQGVALSMADWSSLPQGISVEVFRESIAHREELAARLRDFDVVCLMRERTPFDRPLIERLPALKLIVTSGPRNPAIDIAAANERGILVCGTAALAHTTAELTWGLILALMRHIPQEHEGMRHGGWQRTIGRSLKGATIGICGLGRLGNQVARVAKAFDMDVIAWSQHLDVERAAAAGAGLVTKDELFTRSDVVTLHLVLSDRTRGLVGVREFEQMKPTAFLVNTSRGPIVDEAALISALESGRIAGAGLDVFDIEPLPVQHPLRRCRNVILTPHLGYVTDDMYRVFYAGMVECIGRWLANDPVRVIK